MSSIEALLFEHDPIGLNFEHNTDEYRGEAEVLVLYRSKATSVEDLCGIAHQVFVEWFDADLAGPMDRYAPIAAEFWTLWGNDESAAAPSDG